MIIESRDPNQGHVAVDGNELLINGTSVQLRGVNWEEIHLPKHGQAITEEIIRDRNRTSVCIWSIANESEWYDCFDQAARMVTHVRAQAFAAAVDMLVLDRSISETNAYDWMNRQPVLNHNSGRKFFQKSTPFVGWFLFKSLTTDSIRTRRSMRVRHYEEDLPGGYIATLTAILKYRIFHPNEVTTVIT
jgi:hypothetical protein